MSLNELLNTKESHNEHNSFGVVIGIVTSNNDPEKLGRVKVKFPWRGGEDESFWARIVSLMAGNERGIVFYPEVGDEVLVAFEQGDINHPYILGALWNGKDKPPETNSDGKNNIRIIRSRSGHEIIFNDDNTTMKEKIEVHTKKGHKVVLDDSAGAEKIEVVDKSGNNKITIDSMQNSINIESTMQLKIKSQMIEIESGGMLTIKASGVLTLQGSLIKIN
jgi:uncharacterized protein involved in type VI secretion and phage assembly